MTRDVDRRAVAELKQPERGARWPRRLVTAFALFVLGITRGVSAGEGDLPDLARPSEMPTIVSTPGTTRAASPKPETPSTDRAVLALPGITSRPSTKPAAPTENPPADTAPGGIKLDAPMEMKGSLSPLTPLPRVTPSSPAPAGRSSRPLVLESPSDEPVPIDGTAPRVTTPSSRSSTTSRVEPRPAPAPATQRRGRLFGLLPAAAPVSSPASSSSTSASASAVKPTAPGRSIVDLMAKTPEDPAETALKRRIEKQLKEVVGDRARTIEVHVEGKSATIQARGVKLFQKRGVRKSIEAIPALSGLRSTIEVLD